MYLKDISHFAILGICTSEASWAGARIDEGALVKIPKASPALGCAGEVLSSEADKCFPEAAASVFRRALRIQ